MKCSQCAGDALIDGLRVVDRGENQSKGTLKIELELNPDAVLLTAPVQASVSASVCGKCGNVMFSVDANAVSCLRDAAEILKACGSMKRHPHFKEFLRADPGAKHLQPQDQAGHFAAWLRKNAADS